jgi:hypothetical protein
MNVNEVRRRAAVKMGYIRRLPVCVKAVDDHWDPGLLR